MMLIHWWLWFTCGSHVTSAKCSNRYDPVCVSVCPSVTPDVILTKEDHAVFTIVHKLVSAMKSNPGARREGKGRKDGRVGERSSYSIIHNSIQRSIIVPVPLIRGITTVVVCLCNVCVCVWQSSDWLECTDSVCSAVAGRSSPMTSLPVWSKNNHQLLTWQYSVQN